MAGAPIGIVSASVLVTVSDGIGATGGTATHLGNGFFISCAHFDVVEGREAKVTFPSGREFSAKFVKVYPLSKIGPRQIETPKGDLSALYAAAAADMPSVEVNGAKPETNEEIWQVGYPHWKGPHTKKGTVLRGTQDRLSNILQLTTYDGDSGGGVFNKHGKLIGVTWGGFGDHPNSSHAGESACVAYNRIETFLAECTTWWPGKLVGAPDPNKPRVPGPGPANPVVPAPDLSAFKAEILAAIKVEIAKIPAGPAGPTGPLGPAGPSGGPGSPGLAGPAGKDIDPSEMIAIKSRIDSLEKKLADIHIRIVPRPQP